MNNYQGRVDYYMPCTEKMIGTLSEIPWEVIRVIIDYTVKNNGDWAVMNSTCRPFRSLCPKTPLKISRNDMTFSREQLLWAVGMGASDKMAVKYAAENGYLDVVQAFFHMGMIGDESLVICAVKFEKWDIARYLIIRGASWDRHEMMRHMACTGNIEMLDFLLSNGGHLSIYVSTDSVICRHRDTTDWLRERGCQYNELVEVSVEDPTNEELSLWLESIGYP